MTQGQVNKYFHNYSNRGEQKLASDLINEAISIYGVSCYYISRDFNNYDKLYGTDDSSSYSKAWKIAMYQKNVLGFTGDREFMDKFAGLQIRDQVIFSISRRYFEELIASDTNFPPLPNNLTGPANRPREGDLIWYPFNKKCFKIMYVNLTDMFWQLGKLYTWEVTCELFEYSGEQFNTGIPEVDRIQIVGDLNVLDYVMYDTDGLTPILLDPYGDNWVTDRLPKIYPLQDNVQVDIEANNYIDWNSADVDPFAAGNTGPQSPTI